MVTTTQLRRLRLKYQISLIELSHISGIPNQRLSEYERGERRVPAINEDRIMRALVRLAEERCKASHALREELDTYSEKLLIPMEVDNEL